MKKFRTDKTFYETLEHIIQGEKLHNDYNEHNSEYVSTWYEKDGKCYKVVENIDNGTYYSLEEVENYK